MRQQIKLVPESNISTKMKSSTNLTNSGGHIANSKDVKMDKLLESNLRKIQMHIATYYTNPQCSGFCECHICKQKYELVDKGKQFLRQTSSLIKIETSKIKSFYKLMSSVNNKTSFRLNIPTVCFFQKGQCKALFKSKNQYIIMQQNTQVSKKNIANFFVEANKKKSDTKATLNLHNDNHIRHFSIVVPSYIHGTTEQTEQMKKAKNFYFHKDKRIENDSLLIVQKSFAEQVAIVKYLDNKGYQLLNQKQLRNLLKSPVNTVCIDFIQSYIKPHEIEAEFFFTEYHGYNPPQNNLMWSRSETQVKLQVNLINKYSKDYVPIEHLQSYEEVLKQITQEYILYQTYKMVHYMELVRNLKVNHLTTVWLKDQFREICFFGILNFEYAENQNVQIDYSEVYGVRQMIDRPFNDLENQLLGMWEKIKGIKLQQLQDKSTLKARN